MKRCGILLLLLSLWLPVVSGQSDIQATSLPPLTEESWTFADNGNVYYIGKTTGKVTVTRGGQPNPKPDDLKPPPIIKKTVKWFSLIVDPTSPVQAAYRTDPEARFKLVEAGVEFRTYAFTEADIDMLGLRDIVTRVGLPIAVLQDQDGNIVDCRKINSTDDWKSVVKGAAP